MGVCVEASELLSRCISCAGVRSWGGSTVLRRELSVLLPLACRDRQTQVWGGGNTTADERGAKLKMKED